MNQQHNIRWSIKSLPEHIERAQKYRAAVSADIATRDSHADEEFTMTVGKREFSGKDARTNAGNALNTVVMSWRGDKTLQVRGHNKGFEILSRGSGIKEPEPDLFVRGRETYTANLNPENSLGTIPSIEHVLRRLDRKAEEEQRDVERQEKALADYKEQLVRPFEYEARLKELMRKPGELNPMLDLDKHDTQVVAEASGREKTVPASFAARVNAGDRANAVAQ